MGQPHSTYVRGDSARIVDGKRTTMVVVTGKGRGPQVGGRLRGGDRDRIEGTIRTKPAVYQVASLSLSVPNG